jgi:glycosyltransferase involved in cell wall biosynthesis
MTVGALPLVSILIPCRNEREHIIRCLDSILAGNFPLDDLEVLVIDGMSDDGTAEILRTQAEIHPVVRLMWNPQRIVSSALNIGIRAARGNIIIRMDAHVEYPPDYISGLVAWLERSGADNVGGACVTRAANGTAMARAIALSLSHPFGVGNSQFRLGTTEARRVDTVPFGCYRREVFGRIGLFDEELVRNQDDEFNFRLLRAGGSILLVPGIVSYYYARSSLRQLFRMYYQYGYFKPLVIRKVHAIMTVRQLAPALLLSAVLVTTILAVMVPAARPLPLFVVGGYAAALAAAASTGLRHGVRVAVLVGGAFAVLHSAYGLGFLRGLLDFLVLRKRALGELALSR